MIIIKQKKAITLVIISAIFLSLPSMALAQSFLGGLDDAIFWASGEGGFSTLTLPEIIANITSLFETIAYSLTTLGIVIGGTLYILSIGNEQKISQAKRIILFSMLGFAIVSTPGFFEDLVEEWLGVTDDFASTLTKSYIANVLVFLDYIISALATLFLIIGGIQYITSTGNEQKTARAKQTIFASVAGLLIAGIAGTITSSVKSILSTAPSGAPLESVIKNIISFALSLTAVIALASFIYGGYTYLTSGGNEERLQRGKKVIIYSVVGIAVIMLSAVLTNLVLSL